MTDGRPPFRRAGPSVGRRKVALYAATSAPLDPRRTGSPPLTTGPDPCVFAPRRPGRRGRSVGRGKVALSAPPPAPLDPRRPGPPPLTTGPDPCVFHPRC